MSELQLVEVRLMGEENQVRETIQRMGWVLELNWNGALTPMRRGDGVRAYVQVRVPDLAALEKAMPVAANANARPEDRPDRPDAVTPLQKALREQRRVRRERDDDEARRRQAERDHRTREQQIRTEAIEHLHALGGELLVELDADETCRHSDAFTNADRFRSEDGTLWRVMGEQRCWVLDDHPDDVTAPWLLLADGRVAQFRPPSPPLTRLDPRRDGFQGREFATARSIHGEPRWTITEGLLAHVIVQYERRSAR
ncbi:hypothetical protein [Amycolatopsis minnesotensis]|uniref:Uncharacterized protein n=1 Tax=Amycolatopsis minnesotensis TaxID=337894 RepID=A0ABN2SA81_9PSEU